MVGVARCTHSAVPSGAHGRQLSSQTLQGAAPHCLSSLAKGRSCVLLVCPLLPALYLFIYLLLVLKTKIVSFFNALEDGEWLGKATVCAEHGSHGSWESARGCARKWCVRLGTVLRMDTSQRRQHSWLRSPMDPQL